MDNQEVRDRMSTLLEPCPCGSGKMFFKCCGTEQAQMIANEQCPCGSRKMVKDCCMKSPETHKMS